eukprot:5058825-Karenia_brevis.AAC.1
MFCDAASSPAHLGVVLFVGSKCFWTHADPPKGVLEFFVNRRDKQIMGLELLAISLGFSTFGHLLKGSKVMVHCDNNGAQFSERRGSAKAWDHAQLVHQQWLHAACLGMSLHIVRVATTDNVADLPSRM